MTSEHQGVVEQLVSIMLIMLDVQGEAFATRIPLAYTLRTQLITTCSQIDGHSLPHASDSRQFHLPCSSLHAVPDRGHSSSRHRERYKRIYSQGWMRCLHRCGQAQNARRK